MKKKVERMQKLDSYCIYLFQVPLRISFVMTVILTSPTNGSPLIPELPLLSELPDLGSMGFVPSLLQTVTTGTGTTGTGGVVSTVTTPVTTVPVVMMEPPMAAVLPVIFAVAVVKALILGKSSFYYG